jgi:hypothetical protein
MVWGEWGTRFTRHKTNKPREGNSDMADYLKIGRAALALSVAPKAAEGKAEDATSVEPPNIEAQPDPAELARVSTVLRRAGA